MENVYKSVKTFKCSSNLRCKHNLRRTGTQNGEKQNRTDKRVSGRESKIIGIAHVKAYVYLIDLTN